MSSKQSEISVHMSACHSSSTGMCCICRCVCASIRVEHACDVHLHAARRQNHFFYGRNITDNYHTVCLSSPKPGCVAEEQFNQAVLCTIYMHGACMYCAVQACLPDCGLHVCICIYKPRIPLLP